MTDTLRHLLETAEPAPPCDDDGPPTGPSVSVGHPQSPSAKEAQAAISFLREHGVLNLGEHDAWIRLAIALKNSFGDAAFAMFLELSRDADNFDGEAKCREVWNSLRVRTDGPQLTVHTYFAAARRAGWVGVSSDTPPQPGASEKAGRKPDAAALAVRLAEEAGDEFWLDLEGRPHVSFEVAGTDGEGIRTHAVLSSPQYRNLLSERFYTTTTNRVLSSEQCNLAVALLEHRARHCGAEYAAFVRVGDHAGVIYVDLGTSDGKAVAVQASGWEIVDEPPVRFVRGIRGSLPLPEAAGSIETFQRHFNVSGDDLLRLIGFMIGTFNPDGSYPILLIDGVQGSGKSNLADMVVGLVDPPRQPKHARMSFNPKEQDLHIAARGAHVMFFDNVSNFTADAADALCRLSTGGGSGGRKLYSDDQYHQMVVTRPVIMTCIGPPSSRPDFLSRSLQITAVPPETRRTERAVWRSFEADRPLMFGFLLSCVSSALRSRDRIEAAVDQGDLQLPRLADFAEFVEGAAELLGLKMGQFSKLLGEGQARLQTEAVLGTTVGEALLKHFSNDASNSLEGSATEILAILRGSEPDGRRWPAPNTFRKSLQRIAQGLQGLGIEFEVEDAAGHDNVMKFRIFTTSRFQPRANGQPDPF